ncbi:MAG: tetratricopeptide repeat protein [Alphaproteobacteria bacterium]|nr:tetratricopeptide repeat protein [Alphaproteobacteria bacterium]MCB9793843.1 tetratricopeptide repeat protein [Alphaproteobacteria bacterium]
MKLLLLVLAACAAKRDTAPALADPNEVEMTWNIEDKDVVRLELVETLVSSGEDRLALDMIGSLRADGVAGERLDLLQAEALLGLQLYGEALDILEPKSSRDPERYRLLGLAYLEMGRVDEAIEANQKAVRYSPREGAANDRAELVNNLGFSLAAADRHEEALEQYRAALRVDPSLQRARNNMGFSLAALGRDTEALATFKAVQADLLSDPNLAEANAWFNLGLAREARGDAPAAAEAYQRAISLVPDHARASQALAHVTPPPEQP